MIMHPDDDSIMDIDGCGTDWTGKVHYLGQDLVSAGEDRHEAWVNLIAKMAQAELPKFRFRSTNTAFYDSHLKDRDIPL